ncbi:MAG: DUF1292 domain-containing protein [Bacilli bacterium]|nr:DUF1292 domain-containing protein [Bacilli bacterium]
MEELKKSTFTVKDENGKDVECDVLFTFDSEETKKSYIVYTDNTTDENGNVKVFASIYDPKIENPVLEPITDEKEWKIIETIIETLQEEKNS